MAGEENLGITLSRTLIPSLPSGYLSRRALFQLIDNEVSGTTFLIAPGGYGKTSLVAEWAQNQSRGVIWMTISNGDTLNEMSAMLIAATRQIIPQFAPWFEAEQPVRPTEVVQRWGNELLMTGQEFVFVLDNLQVDSKSDINIELKVIEQFPKNIHFVVLRRDEITDLYQVCSSRGPIKVVTQNDLRFSDEEIEQYAINSEVELTKENREILFAAHGWPSATSLLRAHLQSRSKNIDLVEVMASENEPLRSMALVVIENLSSEIYKTCKRLSVLSNFNLEDAKVILGAGFNFDVINSIAQRGEIFTPSRSPLGGYIFSPMVREIFLEKLREVPDVKESIHRSLIAHFEKSGNIGAAIDQALESGDQAKIKELFRGATRIKQAEGKGGELLRWANFAGDSSIEGELKKSSVRVAGFLADLDFQGAKSEIEKMLLLAESSPSGKFFNHFTKAALLYIYLTTGRFNEMEDIFRILRIGDPECLFAPDEQIGILRLIAIKRYIWNDSEGVGETFLLAQNLGKLTTTNTSHTTLLSIQAMSLHQQGEYKRAQEIATISINQHHKYGYVGNHGPIDAMFVLARCLLEFSFPQQALPLLEQVRSLSYQWKQWHWYLHADKHIIEYHSYNNNQREGLIRIKASRDFIRSFDFEHELEKFIDISEMAVRRRLGDFDRLETLVNRAPDIRDTRTYRTAVDEHRGRKSVMETVKNLPDTYPRDLIWKYLNEVSFNIDSEKVAMAAMKKALQVGAQVGARETFLRQSDEMANYIIKVANEYPTIYNEELASAMAERMRERGNAVQEGRQSLTKRELEILRQLSTGRTLTVIAKELHISQNTIKTHLKNLYKKLGADGRQDAVEKARSTFLI